MPLLRLQTQQARDCARRLNDGSVYIHHETRLLAQSLNSLHAQWLGSTSDLYMAEARLTVRQLQEVADELQLMSWRLEQAVEAWELLDRQGAHDWRGLGTTEGVEPAPGHVLAREGRAGRPRAKMSQPSRTVTSPHVDIESTPGTTVSEPLTEPETVTAEDAAVPDAATTQPATATEGAPLEEDVAPAAEVPSAEPSPDTPAAEPAPGIVEEKAVFSGELTGDLQPWDGNFDEMMEVDQKIAILESRGELTPAEAQHLEALRERRSALGEAWRAGIGGEGLRIEQNPFPDGECTWYATSRRNLYPSVYGHAKYWADQAVQGGLQVGEMPVKGAIMVWQPGIFNAHETYGHVSYVERVERLLDGSFKVFYTDNDHMFPTRPRSVILRPGQEGVDFIY